MTQTPNMNFPNRIHRIFLVRHAESEGNVDRLVHTRMPDHAIPLSLVGMAQAEYMGHELLRWLEANVRGRTHPYAEPTYLALHDMLRVWNSPYKRTRNTAANLISGMGASAKDWIRDRAENILLCEQQFGLFDGVPDEELPTKFPLEHAHYKKCEDFEGRFWARMPMGESRFDVAQRVHQSFGTLLRDAERHDIRNVAIVAHGVTNRAFRMMWMHHSWEWFEAEPNPKNCSISLIEWDGKAYQDRGYIFEGFSSGEQP